MADLSPRWRWILPALLLAGIWLRCQGLDRGLWIDEYSSLTFADSPTFTATARRYNTPPLYYLMLRAWMRLSQSEPFLRALSLAFGVGTLLLLVATLRPWGRAAMVTGALTGAVLPNFLSQSGYIRPYPLLLFGTAATFYFVSRIARSPGRRRLWIGAALSIAFSFGCHTLGVLLLPAALAYLAAAGALPVRSWKWLAGGALLVALAGALTLALFHRHFVSESWWVPFPHWTHAARVFLLNLGVPESALGKPGAGGAWVRGAPWGERAVLFLNLAAAFALMLLVPLGRWRRGFPFFAAFLALWFQLLAVSLFLKPILINRSATLAMIPLLAWLAVHLSGLRRGPWTVAFACLLWFGAGAAGRWIGGGSRATPEKWKAVLERVQREWRPGDVVVLIPDWARREGVGRFEPVFVDRDLIAMAPQERDDRTTGFRRLEWWLNKGHPEGRRLYLVTRRVSHAPVWDYLVERLGHPEWIADGWVRLFRFRTSPRDRERTGMGRPFLTSRELLRPPRCERPAPPRRAPRLSLSARS